MEEHRRRWVFIGKLDIKDREGTIEDYYIEADGCGCCSKMDTPTKETLDQLEKDLMEMMELIEYLRDKFDLR